MKNRRDKCETLRIKFKKQLKITFGDYTEVHIPHHITNSMTARTDPCIALLQKLNEEGSYIFLNLTTNKTCVRNQWIEKPMDDIILKRLEQLTEKQGNKLRVIPHFSRGKPMNEQNEIIKIIDDVQLVEENLNIEDIQIDELSFD